MTLNRRGALAGGAGLAAVMATGQATAADALRVRKSAAQLTASSDDVMAFGDAVRIMKRRTDSLSWEAQNRIHATRAQHGNYRFLPWHRLQVAHLERIVGRLTGHTRFAMPYWDWQMDRYLPSWVVDPASPLYERQRDPGVDRLDFNKARYARSGEVARVADDDFTAFCGRPGAAGRVEAYGHNLIHMLVGGYMSSTATAARDPVFWLHHCNIDRVWATWHGKFGDAAYPQAWKNVQTADFTGPDGRSTGAWRTSRITDTRGLGYQYDRLYAPLVFAVGPGMMGGGPVRTTLHSSRIEARPGDRSLRLELPPEVVRTLREAPGRVTASGEGVVQWTRSDALINQALHTGLVSGGKALDFGAVPTFFHLDGDHAAMAGMAMGDTYGHVFTFGQGLQAWARATRDPLVLVAVTEDLRPDLRRAPPAPASLEFTLSLTEFAA